MHDALLYSFSILGEREVELDMYFAMLRKNAYSEHDEISILRATSFLLLYNAIEATITQLVLDYHSFLSTKTFAELNERLKTHYIDSKLSECKPRSANYETYISKCKEIIDEITKSTTTRFNIDQLQERLPFSGNIDTKYISVLFKKSWGIIIDSSSIPKCINDIKDKRNALAHGRMSFVEVGKDLAIDGVCGLMEYKQETIKCLKYLLESMENHILSVYKID